MITRTFDYRVIKRIIGKNPIISSEFIYLLDEGNLWTFEPIVDGYRIHANMTSKRGKDAVASARCAMKWVFDSTNAKKVSAAVPIENKRSRMLVRHCMKFVSKDLKNHYYEATNV